MQKKIISSFLVITVLLFSLASFSSCFPEKFTVHSCGSGFYVNRDNSKTYTIKELGATSSGNYFYLQDYFYSKEFGTKYTLKKGLFGKEDIYLARKSDHYNSQVYNFDLDVFTEPVLTISEEMCYVNIYATDPDAKREIYIQIEERSLPVDITFENVSLYSSEPTPVIFSKSLNDINIIIKGINTIKAADHSYTKESFSQYLTKGISSTLSTFYKDVSELYGSMNISQEELQNKGLADFITSDLNSIAGTAADYFAGFLEGTMNLLGGKDGAEGLDGIPAIMHAGGISISGPGTISIKGGNGARGADSQNSLVGLSDGGRGGNGGNAISCGKYMSTGGTSVTLQGGTGGEGGNPSKGLLGAIGSSGKKGASGYAGMPLKVTYLRIED